MRVSNLSVNTLEKATEYYNATLERSNLKYIPRYIEPNTIRSRKRRQRIISCFNPLYSLNLASNITRKLLKLTDIFHVHIYITRYFVETLLRLAIAASQLKLHLITLGINTPETPYIVVVTSDHQTTTFETTTA